MSLDWTALRPLNGSVPAAFEELCAQLASCEPSCPIDGAERTPDGSNFVRKGTPDAGVECYWKQPDGSEIAWQAKYFLNPPDNSQWGQIDHSVKTALEKHPQLATYIICLPIDRADPKLPDRESFMGRWNERVEKWQGWAAERGIEVTFKYWGQHEIFARLTLEEHRGRMFFWFNQDFLGQDWFRRHVEETVAQVGPRYTPELCVDVPIAQVIEALGRTQAFQDAVLAKLGKARTALRRARSHKVQDVADGKLRALEFAMVHPMNQVREALTSPVSEVNWFTVQASLQSALQLIDEITDALKQAQNAERVKPNAEGGTPVPHYNQQDDFDRASNDLWCLSRELRSLAVFTESSSAQIVNRPILLVVGKGGTGKTHLLCDTAKHRTEAGLPTALLLGGRFDGQEPWTQIIQQLGLSCSTRDEFFGALEAAGQATNARALILVDALNESSDRRMWSQYLGSMIATLRRYPWVGLCLSVRTSYEDAILPPDLPESATVREEHQGFAEHEYQATRTFFDHYRIAHPAVPLLIPEFQNPLFLKLFCEGLSKSGLTTMPEGLQGMSSIFNFIVDETNRKLSRHEYLDFDPKLTLVQEAVRALARTCAESSRAWIPYAEAEKIVNTVLPRTGHEKSLFRHLLSEGLIVEDRVYHNGALHDAVHFAYEKFGDHLITKYLLDENLDAGDPSGSFRPDRPLGAIVKDELACMNNRGIVEALSIQLPEIAGKELVEIRPDLADWQTVTYAFLESLIWRKRSAFSKATMDYINAHVLRFQETFDEFWDVCLTVACLPDHPFNADRFHGHLMKQGLAERDSWWSTFLYRRYQSSMHGERKTAVDRLVDWAWSKEEKGNIDDEPRRLCGMALAWMLTTSHRFLRDRATKALVNLFTDHLALLKDVLEAFAGVNDPYVSERLHGVAYGCAMRSVDPEGLRNLAQHIYDTAFRNGVPPVDILLRDYARGVIELTLHQGVDIAGEVARIRPPYGTPWPDRIPSIGELEAEYGSHREGMSEEELNQWRLFRGIVGDSDFAIYELNEVEKWSNRRLSEPRRPAEEEVEAFLASLTKRQKRAYDRLRGTCEATDMAKWLARVPVEGKEDKPESREEGAGEQAGAAVHRCANAFRRTLGERKLLKYEELATRCRNVKLSAQPGAGEERFNRSIVKGWVFQRVLELGWTAKVFGQFDYESRKYGPYYGRGAKKPERIGKKYQWIAFHEFLALVADNFQMRGDYLSDNASEYGGPWQLSMRDIDPSWVSAEARREHWESHSRNWWFPYAHGPWRSEPDDVAWLRSDDDLPPFPNLVEVGRHGGSRWLVLESYQQVMEPVPADLERYETENREIWWRLRSYLVRRADADELFEWAKAQNFFGKRMPESPDDYRLFLGEFFWSPAFADRNVPYFGHDGWTGGGRSEIPKPVLVTANHYVAESNVYDCSVDSHIDVALPAKEIVDGMGLTQPHADGKWYDGSGMLVAFDPSVDERGPGAIVVRKDALTDFLERSDLDILWTVLGEKRVLGGDIGRPDKYKGCMVINSVFRSGDPYIKGKVSTFFCPPGGDPEAPLT